MNFLIQIAISVAIMFAGALLNSLAQPKQSRPETKDLEDPTADAGREIPVLFGRARVSGVNVLWFGEKRTRSYQVDL